MERCSTVFLFNKMISVVILSMLIAQSSTSFYSDFSEAIGSVKSKVGKLVYDVGGDLRDTFDCTVDAVEEVIYDKDQISKYYDKCKEISTKSSAVAVANDAPSTISIVVKPILPGASKDVVSRKSGDAVINRDPKDFDKKLASVEKVVSNEYYRVDNMSTHLEHEFDGLSKNVDEKLTLIEKEKENLQKTLLEIKNLHLEEELHLERTKDEIHRAFDEILKKINASTKESDLKSEMNAAMGDLEKSSTKTILEEIDKMKEKGMEQLKDLKKKQIAETYSTSQNSTESNMPRTFKELAAKMSKETTTTNNINNDSTTSRHIVSTTEVVTTVSPLTTVIPIKLVSRTLSQATATPKTLVTQTLRDLINLTESVTRPSTLSSIESVTQSSTVYTTTINSPRTSVTLNSSAAVIESSMVVTTTSPSPVTRGPTVATTTSVIPVTRSSAATTIATIEPVTGASTVATTTSEVPVTRSSAATTTATTEHVTRPPTIITTTSAAPVTRASTVATTTSEVPVTRSSAATTTATTEHVTRASTVATTTSEVPVTRSSAATTTATTEPVTRAPTIITTTSAAPVTRASTVATTTSAVPVTRSSTEPVAWPSEVTTITTTEPSTPTSTITTTTSPNPVTRALSTRTTTTTEQITLATTAASFPIHENQRPEVRWPIASPSYTKNKNPTMRRKKTRNNRFRQNTPNYRRKIALSTPRPSRIANEFVPKNPMSAVAEALSIFGNSMKTKAILDKLFKNLDSVPNSKVF